MENVEHIFFINLDHRVDRLNHVTHQLTNLGVIHKAERFPAIKTTSGAIGCALSHMKCIEIAIARNYNNIFICEDDITFLDIPVFTTSLQKFYSDFSKPETETETPVWDVLIVSGNNGPPFQKISDSYMRIHNCQSTTGYIVNKHYYQTLLKNFKESTSLLVKEPSNREKYAIDMYWKKLQTIHKWYLIIPVKVVQIESYSDVEEKFVDYKTLMLDYDKKIFLAHLMKKKQQRLETDK